MRKGLFTICSILFLAACSAPKYTYYFDHYDYNSGKKKVSNESLAHHAATDEIIAQPLSIDDQTLVASIDDKIMISSEVTRENKVSAAEASKVMAEKYNAMSKAERKEFKKELKKEMKAKKDEVKAVKGTNALDRDAKLAIIFGGIGIIFLLFPGEVFLVLAAISLIIGFVFFVKWISRQ